MTTAFIGFGSNLGDGQRIISSAWNRLAAEKGVEPIRISSPYLTEALDMEPTTFHAPFTNAVGMVETQLSARQLLHILFQIETEYGRQRIRGSHQVGKAGGYLDRSLDLDILSFGQAIVHDEELQLPHPRIGARLFVLAPLCEIAPAFRHPETGQTAAEMHQQLCQRIVRGDDPPQAITTLPAMKKGLTPEKN